MAGSRVPPTFQSRTENATDTMAAGIERLVKALKSTKLAPSAEQRAAVDAWWASFKNEGDTALKAAVPTAQKERKKGLRL